MTTPIYSTDTLDELITRVDRLNPELARAIWERVDDLRDELSVAMAEDELAMAEEELGEFRTAKTHTCQGACSHAQ